MFSLAAQSSSGTSWVILIVVYAVIFGGFYMIFMRPQKKENLHTTDSLRSSFILQKPFQPVRLLLSALEYGSSCCFRILRLHLHH